MNHVAVEELYEAYVEGNKASESLRRRNRDLAKRIIQEIEKEKEAISQASMGMRFDASRFAEFWNGVQKELNNRAPREVIARKVKKL